MEEAAAVIKDPKSSLYLEVTYEPLLEPCDGYGAVGDAGELEPGVLSVELLVKLDFDDTVVVGQLRGEIGVTEERSEFALTKRRNKVSYAFGVCGPGNRETPGDSLVHLSQSLASDSSPALPICLTVCEIECSPC